MRQHKRRRFDLRGILPSSLRSGSRPWLPPLAVVFASRPPWLRRKLTPARKGYPAEIAPPELANYDRLRRSGSCAPDAASRNPPLRHSCEVDFPPSSPYLPLDPSRAG